MVMHKVGQYPVLDENGWLLKSIKLRLRKIFKEQDTFHRSQSHQFWVTLVRCSREGVVKIEGEEARLTDKGRRLVFTSRAGRAWRPTRIKLNPHIHWSIVLVYEHCNAMGIKLTKACADIGIAETQLHSYLRAKHKPNVHTVEAILNYTGRKLTWAWMDDKTHMDN